MGIPVLLVSFILHLRGSLRGTVLLVGSLASFLYQYLLWTFAWAFNSLFLVDVALFSLSLWTLAFVLAGIDGAQVRAAIGKRFPVKTVASFSFALSAMLVLKCLGEILPGVGSTAMPAAATGYYTMVDQALDLGLLAPFGIVAGVRPSGRTHDPDEGVGRVLDCRVTVWSILNTLGIGFERSADARRR